MIREIITPTEQELKLKLPAEYLNRPVEVLVFPLNDTSVPEIPEVPEKNVEALRKAFEQAVGTLSKEQAEAILQQIEEDRQAWETRMESLEKIRLSESGI